MQKLTEGTWNEYAHINKCRYVLSFTALSLTSTFLPNYVGDPLTFHPAGQNFKSSSTSVQCRIPVKPITEFLSTLVCYHATLTYKIFVYLCTKCTVCMVVVMLSLLVFIFWFQDKQYLIQLYIFTFTFHISHFTVF